MYSLIRSEWRFLLFGFLMTFWSSPGQTYFISLFSGEIRSSMSLSDGQFGGIYSIATLLSAAVMVWSGSLVDRISLGKFSIAVVLGLALGCVLLSLSTGVVVLVIAIFLLRQMGQGLMCLASATAMVRYLDHAKGKATALGGIGYAVSEAALPSLLVAMLLWMGWRSSWQLIALALVVVMVPAIYWLLKGHESRHQQYLDALEKDDDGDTTPKQGGRVPRQWTRSEVIRDKRFYLFIPGLMSQQLMFTGFIFHQIHLVESKGWSLAGWASLFAVYAVVSVITKLVVGVLVDRHDAIRMVPLVSLPMGIGLVVLAVADQLVLGGVFVVLMGITVGFQSTVSAPFWSEMYGNRHLGSIKSLASAIMVMFTALSPVVLGLLIDNGFSMETLAAGSAVYVFLTSMLAYYACGLVRN